LDGGIGGLLQVQDKQGKEKKRKKRIEFISFQNQSYLLPNMYRNADIIPLNITTRKNQRRESFGPPSSKGTRRFSPNMLPSRVMGRKMQA